MLETALWIGICAIVIGSNATVIGFLIKIYYTLGVHTRDIKYIKQAIGMNNSQKEETEWIGK